MGAYKCITQNGGSGIVERGGLSIYPIGPSTNAARERLRERERESSATELHSSPPTEEKLGSSEGHVTSTAIAHQNCLWRCREAFGNGVRAETTVSGSLASPR
nr:hypothetical protein Iba_chr04dCG16770 [Ipomoea batatas]